MKKKNILIEMGPAMMNGKMAQSFIHWQILAGGSMSWLTIRIQILQLCKNLKTLKWWNSSRWEEKLNCEY